MIIWIEDKQYQWQCCYRTAIEVGVEYFHNHRIDKNYFLIDKYRWERCFSAVDIFVYKTAQREQSLELDLKLADFQDTLYSCYNFNLYVSQLENIS